MILFDFEYERASSIAEAAARLADAGEGMRLVAGGTDLLPNMRVESVRPERLLSLAHIEPRPPEEGPDGAVRIDALSRLSSLDRSELLARRLPMLAESARVVGSNQVREMGTLGGNLCQENRCLYLNQKHDYQFQTPCYKEGGGCCYPYPNNGADTCWSVYMSDIAPALIALEAELQIAGPGGTRRLATEELFTGVGLAPLAIARDEVLEAVLVPAPRARSGWGYRKSTIRGGLEYGIAVMAVSLRLAEDGENCAGARIVFGSVREGPVRALRTEEALAGAALDDAALDAAAGAASKELNPLPHHGFTKAYIRDNVRVYLRRILGQARDRARGATA